MSADAYDFYFEQVQERSDHFIFGRPEKPVGLPALEGELKTYHHMIPADKLRDVWNTVLFLSRLKEIPERLNDFLPMFGDFTDNDHQIAIQNAKKVLKTPTCDIEAARHTMSVYGHVDASSLSAETHKLLRKAKRTIQKQVNAISTLEYAEEYSSNVDRAIRAGTADTTTMYRDLLQRLKTLFDIQMVTDFDSCKVCWPKWNLVAGPLPNDRDKDPKDSEDLWAPVGRPSEVIDQLNRVNIIADVFKCLSRRPVRKVVRIHSQVVSLYNWSPSLLSWATWRLDSIHPQGMSHFNPVVNLDMMWEKIDQKWCKRSAQT